MGLIGVDEPGHVAPIEGSLPPQVLPEVRIHQAIYQRRSDVHAVCRSMPPRVMSLSALGRTPLARIGFGAYFHPQAPLWDDPLLVRSTEGANALAAQLGGSRAIVMRGNGAVTVGESIEQAVVFAWYLEEAARVELDVLASGLADKAPVFTDEQAAVRAVGTGRLYERMWEFLTAGDSEQGAG
jgi:HCOMODA/2-hydroxy-3-carboxy-muconic semialdehyde decarboxylase